MLTRQEVVDYLNSVYGRVQEKKLKLLCYGLLALLVALLLSLILGDTYDGSVAPLRGKARKTRETSSSSSSSMLNKDPFANRPRIRTKNGHLVIEASQDKNIDFKTSGSGGSVSINGVKLDKLFSVTKAIERSASSNSTLSASSSSSNNSLDQLEWLLRSGSRLMALEKKVELLTIEKADLAKQVAALSRKLTRKLQQMMINQIQNNDFEVAIKNRTSICGGRLVQDSGFIRSPNFPFSYPPRTECVWYIQARPRQQIRLNFTSFDLETSFRSGNCFHDFLEIRNGPQESSPLLGRFCGTQLQSRILVSQSNLLMIRFKSDRRDSRTGFELRFDGAQTGCGGTLNSGSGQIESPNYPFSFPHSADCEWLIEVAQANRIQLTINQLDLNYCNSTTEKINSKENYLAIYDSGSILTSANSDQTTTTSSSSNLLGPASSAKALVKLCKLPQINKPFDIPLSTSNKLFIVYKSQALDETRGFQLSYRTVCDKIELVGFRGSIESPGYPSDYEPNLGCSWLIKAPLGSNLTIALTDLHLNENNRSSERDRRRIYSDELSISSNDGHRNLGTKEDSSAYSVVRVFTGELDNYNDTSKLIQLNSNFAWVNFSSHRLSEGSAGGFRLEWQAQGCGGAQFHGDTIQRLIYHETDSSSPVECLWTYDLSKTANSLDFSIQSDMRVPGVNPSSGSALTERNFLCEDASLTVYDGLTDKAPILFRNCDSMRNRDAIHSSNAQALVKFYSSSRHSNYGRWFSLIGWATNRDNCLTSAYEISSPFNQIAGERKSPNYPDYYEPFSGRCFCMLSTQSGRLKIKLDDLEIPVSTNSTLTNGKLSKEVCKAADNYLVVVDLAGGKVEEIYCGKMDSNSISSELVMEQESAWIEFHLSKFGHRGRWKLSFARLCGSLIYIEYPRTFSTPNYPDAPAWPKSNSNQAKTENVCIWRFKTQLLGEQASSDITKNRVNHKLHLNIINFVESTTDNKTDCLRVYEGVQVVSLKQSSFNLTDIDLKLEPKIKICSVKDIKHSVLQYVSQGSELTLIVSGNARVKFRVKVFENFCGGEYHLSEAEFATLGYPQPYGSNLDCHYFIIGSPSASIKLKFLTFDLYDDPDELSDALESVPITDEIDGFNSSGLIMPTMRSCDNSDYVEIRQLSARDKITSLRRSQQSKIMYKWTQDALLISNTPESLSTNGSSSSISGNSSVVSSNWTSLTNVQQSKKGGKAANILVDLIRTSRLFQDSSLKSLAKQTVSLDDFYENSRLIGRFCGKIIPDFSNVILKDEILVRFRSHGIKSDAGSSAPIKGSTSRGFLAEYKLSYGGSISMLDEESKAGGYISSPAFPTKTRFNNSIRWEFQTLDDSVIKFQLINMDLGSIHENCQDSLSIFDGFSGTSPLMQRLCGHLSFKSWEADRKLGGPKTNHIFKLLPIYLAHDPKIQDALIKSYLTTSNVASVVYENFRSDGMFLLRYKAVNKSSIAENEPQIKNEYWPPLGTGGEIVNTEQSDYEESQNIGNPLSSCSSTHLLSSDGKLNMSQVILSSPNWPKEPPRNIECHWLVYTRENSNIQLSAAPTTLDDVNGVNFFITTGTDSSSSMNYERKPDACLNPSFNEKRNFIAIHDGASRLAPILARHCLPVPPIQFQSTGRHMLIRYVHSELEKSPNEGSVSLTKSLFKARASVGQCGGQYHILTSNRIFDRVPGRSKTYGNNLNCMYYIFAGGADKVLVIHHDMGEFDLSSEPTNSDCSVGDYIEIRDLPIQTDLMDYSRSNSGRLLGRFCAGHKLTYIETPGSAISIKFKTDSENTAKGWQLFIMSSTPRLSCPRGYHPINLDEPFARLISPHWPVGFHGKRRCRFQLVASANQTFELTFLRLNRPKKDGICQDSLFYLADNEASSLKYDTRPLVELQSPYSGTLMRKLLKKLPCQSPASKELPQDNKTATFDYQGYESLGFKKISAEEYFSFKELASPQAFELKTLSHIILLEYDTSNLEENQGFFAILRLAENKKNQCGGDIYYKTSSNSNDSTSSRSNMIKSARFGEETDENEPYIQCDWILHNEVIAYEYINMQHQTISYNLIPSLKVGEFRTAYLVFNTLEIPPATPGTSIMESWTNERPNKMNEMCGLNRLIASDSYFMTSTFVCGNVTTNKWLLLDYNVRRLSLRTKNLRNKSIPPATAGSRQQNNKAPIYSGVLAYFYEKSCVQTERLIGQGVRFRSHLNYPNSSYSPGICKWDLLLTGGDYELWFESINLRPSSSSIGGNSSLKGKNNSLCDINDTNLDYIELRASAEGDSPVITRYCFSNQLINKQKALLLSTRSEMSILFVAGFKQLSNGSEKFSLTDLGNNTSNIYGFDMLLMKTRNESEGEFCKRDSSQNIYSFIRSKDKEYYDVSSSNQPSSFLYPKNTHCVVELSIDTGLRFNLSFKGVFDLESSYNCQNDYVQIDELYPQTKNSTPTTNNTPLVADRNDTLTLINNRILTPKLLGKWCGRNKPDGFFLSKTEKIRITFHSNDFVEGKGFLIEYTTFSPPDMRTRIVDELIPLVQIN